MQYEYTRKTSPSATMRGLPAAPPRRSLRSPHTHTPLASLVRTPPLLASLATPPHAARSARNQPRSAAKRPQLASVHPTRPPTSV